MVGVLHILILVLRVIVLIITYGRLFIGVMLEARSILVITMFEEIRKYVMNRIVAKRGYAMTWKTDFGPNIVSKLEKGKHNSGKCKWIGNGFPGIRYIGMIQSCR